MKWLKHMTNTSDDEKISMLKDKLGQAGYGTWWSILEKIGAEMPTLKDPTITYSERKWRAFLMLSRKKLEVFLNFSAELGLLSVKKHKEYISISCPNILKYCDKYTLRVSKNLVQSTKTVPKVCPLEVEVEEEEEYNPPNPPLKKIGVWEQLLSVYPPTHRIGEDEARLIFGKLNQVDRIRVFEAVKEFKKLKWDDMISNGDEKYIPTLLAFVKKTHWKAQPVSDEKKSLSNSEIKNYLEKINL